MTIHIAPFDPHTASDQLWTAFNETRRAIACEFWRTSLCSMTPKLGEKSRRQEAFNPGGGNWSSCPHLRHSPTAVRPSQLGGFGSFPVCRAWMSRF